jgi:imidazolonepropionase
LFVDGWKVEISATYLGAHSVPPGRTASDYAAEVISVQIPAITAAVKDGAISVENVDVFYEKGVFERPETAAILSAGRAVGLRVNFHGDELSDGNSGLLAKEYAGGGDRVVVSHLEHLNAAGV